MSEWQPMETAPKDGTSILVTDNRVLDAYHIVYWDDEAIPHERLGLFAWAVDDTDIRYHEIAFTHWMFPPEAPPL